MSATDELRRLLDERGVEWSDISNDNVLHTTWGNMSCWFIEFHDGWTSWGMAKHGTPSQAIEATLGESAERTCRCVFDGNMDGTSVCSECGGEFPQDPSRRWRLNYCPNCGAKVVEE